jgi:EPS-associated MarR family transcriptional regulator
MIHKLTAAFALYIGRAVAVLNPIKLLMSTKNKASQEDTRFRVLRLLEENPSVSQRAIANELDISLGGVNYCLKALIAAGLVKMRNFHNNKNKLAYAYYLTPKGIKEKSSLASDFLKRKMHEYESLKHEIETLRSEASDNG